MVIERISPGPGQESVWDYPRPPRCESCDKQIVIKVQGIRLADSRRTKRVLETSHPPVYYIPREDIRMELLTEVWGIGSVCEWKGEARYFDVQIHDRKIEQAAWSYPSPAPAFAAIREYLAFYPHLMDACYVDGELVQPQSGCFYGGWITSDIVGPFKGQPGTWGW